MNISPHYIIIFAVLLTTQSLRSQTSATVEVDPRVRYQTIDDISGNFCQYTYSDSAWDAVGEYMLTHFEMHNVRVPLPLMEWEPENDNENPHSMNFGQFNDSPKIEGLLLLMKDMVEHKGVEVITASAWNVPDWMVVDPSKRSQRVIKPELYDEAVECIAAYLIWVKDRIGFEIDYISFNESNGGYQVLFTPSQTVRFITLASRKFRRLGLKTNFLSGDTHDTKSLIQFARPALTTPEIAPFMGPISFHSWWSTDKPNDIFIDAALFGKRYRRPVWCTELGHNALLYRQKGAFQTYDNAFELAKITLRVLKYSMAEVLHYWTFQHNFPLMSRDLEKYPAYYVMAGLLRGFPDGVRIVNSKTSNDAILSLACAGSVHTLQLINTDSLAAKIDISGMPEGDYNVYVIQEGRVDLNAEPERWSNGSAPVILPPGAIAFLSTAKLEDK